MKIALDTNVLVYGEGMQGPELRASILDMLGRLPPLDIVLPVQVLGELFNVLSGRAGWSRDRAQSAVQVWRSTYRVVDTSIETLSQALDLAVDHRLSTWDAVILAAASRSGCQMLLSEDMHHGFSWGGVTVVNPFAPLAHPLLSAALVPRR